jgi:hypothetical protein
MYSDLLAPAKTSRQCPATCACAASREPKTQLILQNSVQWVVMYALQHTHTTSITLSSCVVLPGLPYNGTAVSAAFTQYVVAHSCLNVLTQKVCPVHDHDPCICFLQAFLTRARYSQQQLVLGVQPSHLLMPAASMVLKPPELKHLPLVPMACPKVSRGDTLLSHARKMHNMLLGLAAHAMTSMPDICAAAGVTPAAGGTHQQALFHAAVVYARDAAAGRAAAAGLDVALLLLLPGPKPGCTHVLQALLLTSQGRFSQEGAHMMARHFEVRAGVIVCNRYKACVVIIDCMCVQQLVNRARGKQAS